MSQNTKELILDSFPTGKIIKASKLYKDKFDGIFSEFAFYKQIERMVKANLIEKVAKGEYTKPQKSKFGNIPLSDEKIIFDYTKSNSGLVIGNRLYNNLHLTNQVPKDTKVYSNSLDQNTKKINNIYILRMSISFTPEVSKTIEMFEVLDNFEKIQDINYFEFIEFCKEYSKKYNEKTVEYVISKIKYSKNSISFLNNILNYYKVENNLDKHLSRLSNYSHPKMEDITDVSFRTKSKQI